MKLPHLSASLLARQTPAVRALLAKAQRRDPTITTEVTRDGEALVIALHGVKMPSLSNVAGWKSVNRAKQAQSKVLRPLLAALPVPPLPLDVEIVRVAKGIPVDVKNLDITAKRLIDDIAKWCGEDDRTEDRVRYAVRQEHGDVCVRIRIGPMQARENDTPR